LTLVVEVKKEFDVQIDDKDLTVYIEEFMIAPMKSKRW